MAKFESFGEEDIVGFGACDHFSAFCSGLCDGFFAEDGADFLRFCNLIAQAGVKAAPGADDGDVEVFIVEHQVEIRITFSDVKFASISLNCFGQDIADGDDFCAVRIVQQPDHEHARYRQHQQFQCDKTCKNSLKIKRDLRSIHPKYVAQQIQPARQSLLLKNAH